jgi:tripartite-type tricarboxylate transporter receptor subunit TctC
MISTGVGDKKALLLTFMVTGVIMGMGMVFVNGIMVAPLCAQSYPNRPIRFIVPWPPGGANDIFARIVAPKLAERLGQPVVVENRPGAGGTVGTEMVAKSPPDGYTILIGAPGALAISSTLYRNINFNPVKDFATISLVAQTPNALLVHKGFPVKDINELVNYAKTNPGKINFGSVGIASAPHMAGELLKSLAKIEIIHVPYKGASQMMVALAGGEVDIAICSISAALQQLPAGKLKALAVLSAERLRSLPNVPTAKETGIEGLEVTTWYGLLAPAGTPREIINRLYTDWKKVEAMPDTLGSMEKAGLYPMSGSPEQFSKFLQEETLRWGKIIKELSR